MKQGNVKSSEYIEEINKFLKDFPNDSEAWLELGDIYI